MKRCEQSGGRYLQFATLPAKGNIAVLIRPENGGSGGLEPLQGLRRRMSVTVALPDAYDRHPRPDSGKQRIPGGIS